MKRDNSEAHLNFCEVFDLQQLQQIQDAFATAMGVASIITDPTGTPITNPSNFCKVCTLIRATKQGLANCIQSDYELGSSHSTELKISKCKSSGLWDVGTALMVDHQHIANWLVGQVLLDEVHKTEIIKYAEDIDADREQIEAALDDIPRMSKKRILEISQLLFLFAHQLSKLATENVQKEREILRRVQAERLQAALYQISETANSARNLDDLYASVHQIIHTLIPAKNFYIALKDDEQGMLHFPYRVDECDGNPGSRKLMNGLAEYAIEVGKPMLIDPQMRMDMEQKGIVQTMGRRAMDWLGVPLKTADDKVFGSMAVFTFVERVRYTKEHQEILSFVSNQVAMAISRKKAADSLLYLSKHDQLTGLFNRSYFEKKIKQYETNHLLPLTILMCDIDGLKLINDTLGHAIGDQLLVATAEMITKVIRKEDIAARIGGDEFVILLPQAEERDVYEFTKGIHSLLAMYNQENGGVHLSLSIGHAVKKTTQETMQEILKKADNAMYREKLHHSQSGRSAIVQTMMQLLEERDFITEQHGERLQYLISQMADKLNLSESRIADLCLFASFHDIGKVGIPDQILFKKGPLNAEEKKEMQRHCEIGYRIAQASADLFPIADWILKHQEWWNGQGYPLGLAGKTIPLECRILSIADAYDAMTNDRPYRKAMSHEDAIKELQTFAGIQFDPKLVDVFIRL